MNRTDSPHDPAGTTDVAKQSVAGLRLGSMRCLLRFDSAKYARMLASVFGTELISDPAVLQPPETEIILDETVDPTHEEWTNRLEVRCTDRGHILETDPLVCTVDTGRRPYQVRMTVRNPAIHDDTLAYHFWIVTNRWLLLTNRLVLHAAAILLGDSVLVFSGPKGAGKSTLSLALAASGGVIIGEDHLVARRSPNGMLISGCSGRMRVTRQTEEHFLRGRLPADAIELPDGLKKEFQARHVFPTRPYEDFRPERLFFNRVGSQFLLRPLSKKDSLLTLLRNTSEMQRFGERAGYASFLSFLADFTEHVPAFDLELGNSLSDLEGLARRLSWT